jgi:hypothetical protein
MLLTAPRAAADRLAVAALLGIVEIKQLWAVPRRKNALS